MSSKRAYYFVKNFNWKEMNNLFAYDVKRPERLSKRQQILRLYKNCGRRIYELEVLRFTYRDLHSYAARMRNLRDDFDKLKNTKSEKEVDEMLEKYEQFIEYTFHVSPWVHDNVSYEWRHAKGLLPVYTKEEIETDLHGYYDKKLLSYYPKSLEWQFRDEYPFDDALGAKPTIGSNEWETVIDTEISFLESNVKSPQDFAKEVEELRFKYNLKTPDMWEKPNQPTESKEHNQNNIHKH